jgi:tetratricopeptide (TPR) repeat protein
VIAHPCQLFSIQIFASLAGLLFATVANAQFLYDEVSVAKLPPYCRNAAIFRDQPTGGKNPADIERWIRVMGKGFIHIHHYCWGLQLTHRALFESPTKFDRDRDLRRSIPEFDYVIAAVDSNFSLLPEILTKKGENLFRLERNLDAIATLVRAIEVKSDYWPPYAALSDYYKERGKFDEARNWLKRGLAASGGAKALERRLRELPPN